jgi:CubicO group peptidase (beta-lactamase class C family)
VSAARGHDARAGSICRAFVLIAVWVLVTTPPLAAQDARPDGEVPAAIEARLAEVFGEFAKPGAAGAAVVVARGDTIVLARAFGLADVERRVPMTPTTAFRLASVTKQFTAAAILALVEDGRLVLDGRLGDLLPDAPRYAHDVRVRHLLAHTSGIPDYEPLLGSGDGPQLRDHDVLALLHEARSLYFPPGSSWRYSNSGYALLALIVERVTGESFAAFLRRRIFDRAGMPNAVAHVEGRDTVLERAYGHSFDHGAWRRTDQSRTSAVLGDGGIYASAVELARWSAALDNHAVMSAETFTQATTPVSLPSGAPTHYGFGWFLDTYRGHRRQRHEGDSIGFRTAIQRYPDARLTVIVLANRSAAPIDALSDAVADLFLPR